MNLTDLQTTAIDRRANRYSTLSPGLMTAPSNSYSRLSSSGFRYLQKLFKPSLAFQLLPFMKSMTTPPPPRDRLPSRETTAGTTHKTYDKPDSVQRLLTHSPHFALLRGWVPSHRTYLSPPTAPKNFKTSAQRTTLKAKLNEPRRANIPYTYPGGSN